MSLANSKTRFFAVSHTYAVVLVSSQVTHDEPSQLGQLGKHYETKAKIKKA